jgi:glucose-1-phosphate thymidylyltransferase
MADFMNALILAAGYATRLYPLTLNKAKPLLEVAGKPIIEWLADNLANVPELETIYVVTNDKFASDFQAWADSYKARQQPDLQIKIINDGSRSDDDKLGAIGDINLLLTREDNLKESNLLVVAGDNLFTEPLTQFVESAKNAPATVAVHDVGDPEAMKKYGAVTISANGNVTHFEEKPERPQSTLAAMALYYYSREVLPMFTTYLAAGNNPDQPGRFLQWLYTRKPVKAFQMKGHWLDIGSKETLAKAGEIFANK